MNILLFHQIIVRLFLKKDKFPFSWNSEDGTSLEGCYRTKRKFAGTRSPESGESPYHRLPTCRPGKDSPIGTNRRKSAYFTLPTLMRYSAI